MYLVNPGEVSGWSCEDFQKADVITIKFFDEAGIKDYRFKNYSNLNYKVLVINSDQFTLDDGRNVHGVTYCKSKEILISSRPFSRSAFSHELAHAIQDCTPTEPYNSSDYYHSNWDLDNINLALEYIRNYKED